MRTLRAILNEGNPNKLPTAAQLVRLGDAIALTPRRVRSAVAANVLALAENQKAEAVLSAFSVAGTVTGALTPVVGAPATGQVGVNVNGDIVFAGVDAVTEAEVVFVAKEGQIVEEVATVVANSATLAGGRKALQLLEVTALTGTTTGALTVAARGAAPGAGAAAQNLDGGTVAFNAADAVESARIKYVAAPGAGTVDAVGVGLDSADRQF